LANRGENNWRVVVNLGDIVLMNEEQTKPGQPSAFNVPNQLTSLRLLLAVVMFCLMPFELYMVCMVLFVVAAGTDWLDGWYARKYGQVTVLGRILDPFADKIIICGTFIFLVAEPQMAAISFGLRAWMVVLIVARELLVTVLRSFIEQRGGDFSAKMSGKLKMVFQCITAASALLTLSFSGEAPAWVLGTFMISLWAAVFLTVYSGMVYIIAATNAVRGK
jgi:CDP-diacylglycerol---glycerol-3-phosphate 3-phosphatidyltransferase